MDQLERECFKEIEKNNIVKLTYKKYKDIFKEIRPKVNKQIESAIAKIQKLKRNKIVIVAGYPGSGKSTVTEMLSKSGYKVLSLDDKIKNYAELNKITKDEIEKKGTTHIVLDGTFLRQKDFDRFAWTSKITNLDLIVILMDIPILYAYYNNVNRCLDRRRSNRKLVPYKVYESMEKTRDVVFPKKGLYVINYQL